MPNPISISLQKQLVIHDEIIYVDLAWQKDIEPSLFSVRPLCEGANILIHNPVTDTWVNSTDALSDMPPLQQRMYIKVLHLVQEENLWFEIRNIKTSETFITNKVKVWPYEEFAKTYFTTLVLPPVSKPTSVEVIQIINDVPAQQQAYKWNVDHKAMFVSLCVFVLMLLIVRRLIYAKKLAASNTSDVSYISTIINSWRSDKFRRS